MTNAEARRRMLTLVESCETYEQVVMALVGAIENQWADDTDCPAQLGTLLDTLRGAADQAQELDDVSQ